MANVIVNLLSEYRKYVYIQERNKTYLDVLLSAAREYKIVGCQDMNSTELRIAVNRAEEELDAKLLNIPDYHNKTNEELEDAVEDAWSKLEAYALGIKDDEEMSFEELREEIENGIDNHFSSPRKYPYLDFRDDLRKELKQAYLWKQNNN